MRMKRFKIYIATHKLFTPPKDRLYKVVKGGSALHEIPQYKSDAKGKNISRKNPNYCELTVLYWMWKNAKQNILGLCHYRRYFSLNGTDPITLKEVKELFRSYNLVVPIPFDFGTTTVEENYALCHAIEDYQKCRELIYKHYPEYSAAFEEVSQSTSMYYCNMLVTTKELLNDYCSWLFPLLEYLESEIDLESYDDYNKRVFGFLSERLLPVWVVKNKAKLKIKELPLLMTEETTELTTTQF